MSANHQVEICDEIGNRVAQTVASSLRPFFARLDKAEGAYSTVQNVLKEMPEFKVLEQRIYDQDLIIEGLRNRIAELSNRCTVVPINRDPENIKLSVADLECAVSESDTAESDEELEEEEASVYSEEGSIGKSEEAVAGDSVEEEEVEVVEAADVAESDPGSDSEYEEYEEEDEEEEADDQSSVDAPIKPRGLACAEQEEEEEEEEEEVVMVVLEIDDEECRFYTNDEENGDIYEVNEDESVGKVLGRFEDGDPVLFE